MTDGGHATTTGPPASVDLFWIPLGAGAGGQLVRWSGRIYEGLSARRAGRPAADLYHSALAVRLDGTTTTIEMAPVWVTRGERGVVAEGAVGLAALGRFRVFRYEVRRWRDGTIPDAADAVGGASRVCNDQAVSARILELVPAFPTMTWGRDETGTGDMWNSNSLVSWLLVGAGLDVARHGPPPGGRAPGWAAGRTVASNGNG